MVDGHWQKRGVSGHFQRNVLETQPIKIMILSYVFQRLYVFYALKALLSLTLYIIRFRFCKLVLRNECVVTCTLVSTREVQIRTSAV